jgi:hypothetical protein
MNLQQGCEPNLVSCEFKWFNIFMGEQNTLICQHTLKFHRSVREKLVQFILPLIAVFRHISCLSKHKIPYSCTSVRPSGRPPFGQQMTALMIELN